MKSELAILVLIFIFGVVACGSDSRQDCCTTMESGARDALRRRGFLADSMTFCRPSLDDSALIYTFESAGNDLDRLVHGFELRPYDLASRRYLRSQRDGDPLYWRNDNGRFWGIAPGRSIRFSLQATHRIAESQIELLFDQRDDSLGDANNRFLGSLSRGNTATFKLILESGIDLNAPTTQGSALGIEALTIAYVRGETTLVRQLLEMGVPPCDPIGLNGDALIQAVWNRDIATLGMLLKRCPEWNEPCITGAAAAAIANGDVEILDLLVAQGLDIDRKIPEWKSPGAPADPDHPAAFECALTLLMRAAMDGQVECVKYLLAHGARVDVETDCADKFVTDRWSALSLAEMKGHHEIVRLLEEALAN